MQGLGGSVSEARAQECSRTTSLEWGWHKRCSPIRLRTASRVMAGIDRRNWEFTRLRVPAGSSATVALPVHCSHHGGLRLGRAGVCTTRPGSVRGWLFAVGRSMSFSRLFSNLCRLVPHFLMQRGQRCCGAAQCSEPFGWCGLELVVKRKCFRTHVGCACIFLSDACSHVATWHSAPSSSLSFGTRAMVFSSSLVARRFLKLSF